MGKILSETDSQHLIKRLTEVDREEIKRDKVRFGEYFIAEENQSIFRVNPLNVIDVDGSLRQIMHTGETFI